MLEVCHVSLEGVDDLREALWLDRNREVPFLVLREHCMRIDDTSRRDPASAIRLLPLEHVLHQNFHLISDLKVRIVAKLLHSLRRIVEPRCKLSFVQVLLSLC